VRRRKIKIREGKRDGGDVKGVTTTRCKHGNGMVEQR